MNELKVSSDIATAPPTRRQFWVMYGVFALDTLIISGLYFYFGSMKESGAEMQLILAILGTMLSFAWAFINRRSIYWGVYRQHTENWKLAFPLEDRGRFFYSTISYSVFLGLGLKPPAWAMAISIADSIILAWALILFVSIGHYFGGSSSVVGVWFIAGAITSETIAWIRTKWRREGTGNRL